MRTKQLGLLLALVLPSTGSLSGCSWLFVEPLSSRHIPGDYANCTTNPAAPIVDTVFTAGGAALAIDLVGRDNSAGTKAAASVGVLSGVLFSSALYGYLKTSECRDANGEAEAGEEKRAPRGILRRQAPPTASPQPQPQRKGGPLLTAPPATPTSPGQREDEDEDQPSDRRGPRPPAEKPNVPTSGA